jgi:uncharacterized protein (DUF427 family)
MRPKRIEPVPGQESVWDYPRPPRLEQTSHHIQVIFAGAIIADTTRAWRVLETSHPPTYYIPPEDIRMEYLEVTTHTSFCEWKGAARYYTVRVEGQEAVDAAWAYPQPTPSFTAIRDHVAFYAGRMERCLVDGEEARPQPGGFYGGWVTSKVVGPFKGEPGTLGW